VILAGRVALVTGANHGIGAATATALAALGADVAATYLRFADDVDDSGRPGEYARQRGQTAAATVASIEASGVRAHAVEIDLADPSSIDRLFNEVEAALGPVSVLVHNASGWRTDSFNPDDADRFGRSRDRVSAETFDAQFHVDARAGACSSLPARRAHCRPGPENMGLRRHRPIRREVCVDVARKATVDSTQTGVRGSVSTARRKTRLVDNVHHAPFSDVGTASLGAHGHGV